MRLALNVEPRYMVITLTREEWTVGPGTPRAVKGLIWYTDGSWTRRGTGGLGPESMGNFWQEGSVTL
jgi:hypothetical protein